MSTQCPECQKRLESFAVSCDKCGWSLVETVHHGKPVDGKFEMAFDLAYEQAMRHLDKSELDQAAALAESALHVADNDSQRGEATALRGYIRLKRSDAAGAEKDCSKAIELGWRDHRVFAWRAAARGQQNKWPAALDDLKIAGSRNDADARRYAGYEMDYLQRANQWYQAQLATNANDASLWFGRGWVRMQCGDSISATTDLNRALDLEPSHHHAALGMALLAMRQREYRRSVEFSSRASCSPDPAIQWSSLACRARANYHSSRVTESRTDVARLRKLAGQDQRLLLEHARIRAELGDTTLALGDLKVLLEKDPGLVEAWALKGQLYARLGNHKIAIERLGEALRLKPDDAAVLVSLGQSHAALGKTDLALEAFTQALKIDRQSASAWIGQSQMYLAAQNFDGAMTAIDQAIKLDDQRAESHGVRGQIRFGLCEYRDSVEDFSRAIELASDRMVRADLFYRRGTALHEQGELDRALADFVSSSQLNADQVGTWVWRAAVHSRLQRWNETVADLQQVMRFRSDQARSYLTLARPVAQRCIDYFSRRIQRTEKPAGSFHRNRGLAHEFLGNGFQAIEDYRLALEQERGEPFVTLRLARLLQHLGQHKSAIEYLSRLIRRDRTHHAARYARAISSVAVGEHQHGMSDAIKAIQTAPEFARYRLLRGELRMRKGDLERAKQDFDRAIWLDSNDPAAWRLRASVYLKAGQPDQAIRDLTHAIDLAGEPVELICRRGEALLKTGNATTALIDFEHCIRMKPSHLPSVVGRGMAFSAQNRPQDGLIWLTKSLHQFGEPMDMARILLARAKIYYRMGSSACAVADFTTVLKLVSGDTDAEVTARFGRAMANIQHGKFDAAARDLKKYLLYRPGHRSALEVQAWLEDRSRKTPNGLLKPSHLIRLDRPRVTRSGVPVGTQSDAWKAKAPYDTWVVRNKENHEYGPVPKATLDKWVEQGRIDVGMKLLRGDWPRWKRAEKIYSKLEEHARRS